MGNSKGTSKGSDGGSRADFDLLVIGAGSAGGAAACVAGARGATVGLVESGPLGGLCVLEACMPSKALLQSATRLHRVRTAGDLGVRCAEARLDFARVMARKRALVDRLAAERREELQQAPGVTVLRGRASFAGRGEVVVRPLRREPLRVEDDAHGAAGDAWGEGRSYRARKVVIASGSYAWAPPLPGLAEAGYITSGEALDLDAPPESLIVLGGGAIALELGQFYARAGSRVTLLEQGERILDGADAQASDALAGLLRADGIDLHTEATVEGCARRGGERLVRATVAGQRCELAAQVLLVATGRRGRVAGLELAGAGIALDEAGAFVRVDEAQRTTNPDVYAAGDVTSQRQMTHLAVQQGEVAGYNVAPDLGLCDPPRPLSSPAAQRLGGIVAAGPDGRLRLDLSVVPQVLFTDPGHARVGLDEDAAREAGIDCATARYRFADLGMAILMGETEGFVKMLARRDDGRILGVEILGPQADTLIQEAVLALACGVSAGQLARLPHYHPTLSEILARTAERLTGG